MTQPGRGTGRLVSIGPYTLLDRIGAGGMGIVYRALDRRSGTVVAFKLLHEHVAADPAAVERFRREAHVASLLRSAYAVHTLDFGNDEGRYYLVSEFVEGRSLAEVLRSGRPEPLAALAIVSQAALALDEAESRQVTHRDIKPDNILVTDDGSVKLADFGIAALPYLSGLTQAGSYVGTVAYSAPEQHHGNADIRSDIYSLGVVLYELLAGARPFEAASPAELMRQHESEPLLLEPLAGIPPELVAVVARCMEKDPAARYQHPSELIAALHEVRGAVAGAALDDSWMSAVVADIGATGVFAVGESAPPLATPLPPHVDEAAEGLPPPETAGFSGAPIRVGTDRPGPTPPVSPHATVVGPVPAGAAGGGGRNRMLLLAGGLGGALLAAVVVGVFVLAGGGDDDTGPAAGGLQTPTLSLRESPVPSSTNTPSPTAQSSSSPPASPSAGATFESGSPPPGGSVTPGGGQQPPGATATRQPPTPTTAPPPATATTPPQPSFSAPVFATTLTQSGLPPAGATASGGTIGGACPGQLYAYVSHQNLGVGATMQGAWTFNGGSPANNPPFASDGIHGATYYQYNLSGQPNGLYGFTLRVNGAAVSQGSVRIAC